ncbi:MAG: 50S ribosomal protein L29 [Methanobacteriota archaeon]
MVLKPDEIRRLSPVDRKKRLDEFRAELMHENGVRAMGGAPKNPGRIRELHRGIARILTVMQQNKEG